MLGVIKLRTGGNEIRCALPNHNNATSVRVKKDTLYIRSFDDTFNMSGDIYSFIMQLNNVSLMNLLEKLHIFWILNLITRKEQQYQNQIKQMCCTYSKKIESKVNSNSCRDEEIEIFNELPEEYTFFTAYFLDKRKYFAICNRKI